MKKYALLYFQQINEKFSKWIFPLHEGENIIGSDRDVDIFLYLNKSEDIIDGVHCKIIVNENDIGIISLTSSGYVKREQGLEKIILSPGKEYELKNKTIFYLTDNIKFILIKGTINEIHDFFLSENLENEFQKWNKFILTHENKMKINLNLSKKESYNTFVSNNEKNNNNFLLNNAKTNKNINKISNSILYLNNKEINRMGFNNYDEIPEDNIINDLKISQQIANNSPSNNLGSNQMGKINFELNKNGNNIEANNKENISNNINKDVINNSTNNEGEINLIKSEIKEERKQNNYNNSLEIFNQTISEYKKNNNEKIIKKDEKTLQIIRELLGENNLEIISNNTNYKNIKEYDISFKKQKIL